MTKGMARIGVAIVVAVAASPWLAEAERPQRTVHVAIVTDGPSERTTTLRALFLEELRTVNRGEFDIQAPVELQLEADRTLEGVTAALERALADRRTDLVVMLGLLGSHAAAQRSNLPKPVLAPFVADPELQGLPYDNGASGRKNLSYISLDVDIVRDLGAFREIVPFTRLAVLLDGAILDAIPGVRDEMTRAADELGLTVTPLAVADAAEPALAAIAADVQTVYVGPLLRLSPAAYQRLITGLIERRLPSFAFFGRSDVELGLLLGSGPALQMDRLARRVALNARRILLGEAASALPVAFARQEGLVLNMRTARAIGFSPSWQLLTRAELLHDEPEAHGPPLTFAGAIRKAVELNLGIRLAESNVAAGQENIREARAALLPQIGLDGGWVEIEEDDASAIPGRAQRITSGSVTLEQSLYSEPARANIEVQKQFQAAREDERDRVRLDIVLETAQAYLGVLRAETNERVQKNDLRLTRSNLELARVRRRIGTAGPSEVYRWESEIANAQRAVDEAQTRTRVAEIALNALLHRAQEEAVATAEVGLDEPTLIAGQQRLYDLIDNPERFRVFRDFVVRDALAAVPELRQIDALLEAQERTLQSAQRAFWHPSLGLRLDRTETFGRSGARAAPLPGLDDHETTVALQLSLPLFTGGARRARRAEASETLAGLRVQRRAVAERVEQRVRSALHIARSAYTSIRLSRLAAGAAQSNLDVVLDAYSRGTVSILDLLDAQNAARTADLRAATAVYGFMDGLMEVERATARFDFFLTPEDQADWFSRAERYFAEQGVPVLQP